MSTNFNVKSFGLNVIPDLRQGKQAAHTVEKAIGDMWEPVLDYLATNDNVFSGEVAKEINKINIQTMQLGTIVNADRETKNLDTQF
mgnify:FL=1